MLLVEENLEVQEVLDEEQVKYNLLFMNYIYFEAAAS